MFISVLLCWPLRTDFACHCTMNTPRPRHLFLRHLQYSCRYVYGCLRLVTAVCVLCSPVVLWVGSSSDYVHTKNEPFWSWFGLRRDDATLKKMTRTRSINRLLADLWRRFSLWVFLGFFLGNTNEWFSFLTSSGRGGLSIFCSSPLSNQKKNNSLFQMQILRLYNSLPMVTFLSRCVPPTHHLFGSYPPTLSSTLGFSLPAYRAGV